VLECTRHERIERFLAIEVHTERRELAKRADVACNDRPAAQAAFDDAAAESLFLRMHPDHVARDVLVDEVR
jgi:hypothetical protein